ncbi:MAG: hypothetical protein HOJ45_05155 [Gemmatimonadetes bacterium]|nr:hypothetical protein [Gemmatimonadota bacterium]
MRSTGPHAATLNLQESAGITRSHWPMTQGVPLAQGSVQNVEALRLSTASGDLLAAQLRPLALWPDGSVKWVLADWQTDMQARQTSVLTLGTADTAPPVDDPSAAIPDAVAADTIEPDAIETDTIEIDETDAAVTVCTGKLRFEIRRDRVSLFEQMQLGQRVQGSFVPTETIGMKGVEIWAKICEGESFGGTRRQIYGPGGKCVAQLAPDAWSVAVEEMGALRSVITC